MEINLRGKNLYIIKDTQLLSTKFQNKKTPPNEQGISQVRRSCTGLRAETLEDYEDLNIQS